MKSEKAFRQEKKLIFFFFLFSSLQAVICFSAEIATVSFLKATYRLLLGLDRLLLPSACHSLVALYSHQSNI